jgi:hypothetical protein
MGELIPPAPFIKGELIAEVLPACQAIGMDKGGFRRVSFNHPVSLREPIYTVIPSEAWESIFINTDSRVLRVLAVTFYYSPPHTILKQN